MFEKYVEIQVTRTGEHEHNFCPFGDIQVEIGRRDQQWQHTLLPINENCKILCGNFWANLFSLDLILRLNVSIEVFLKMNFLEMDLIFLVFLAV